MNKLDKGKLIHNDCLLQLLRLTFALCSFQSFIYQKDSIVSCITPGAWEILSHKAK